MIKKPKVIAVFLAYNVANTLKKFWQTLPKKYFDECILVDDGSKDKTFEIAKSLKGITVYKNPINLGYGGNLKRALSIALTHGADIIVDIHPDNEYKPSAIFPALEKIQKEGYQFILGNRFAEKDSYRKNGMFTWKVLPIKTLNFIDGVLLGVKIHDLHQGFRVYTKNFLTKVNFIQNSDKYLFSFELIAQAVLAKIKIGEVPVETKYSGKKRGASLKNVIKYSLGTFKVLLLYFMAKAGIKNKIFIARAAR